MKNLVTINRLLPFDADASDLKKTNPFYNQPAVFIDGAFYDTCGTDCLVAYLYDSEEDAKEKLGDAFKLANEYANSIDQKFDVDHPFFIVAPEEKAYLVPSDIETAKALLVAQTKDTTNSINRNTKTKNERDSWFVFSHAPYMYEKLGRVSANCYPLLSK